MGITYFLQDEVGNISFTKEGLEFLGPYFGKADIDILSIRTIEDYYEARRQASPHFMAHLQDVLSEWPDTDETRLVRSAVFDENDEFKAKNARFKLKKSLRLINGR